MAPKLTRVIGKKAGVQTKNQVPAVNIPVDKDILLGGEPYDKGDLESDEEPDDPEGGIYELTIEVSDTQDL